MKRFSGCLLHTCVALLLFLEGIHAIEQFGKFETRAEEDSGTADEYDDVGQGKKEAFENLATNSDIKEPKVHLKDFLEKAMGGKTDATTLVAGDTDHNGTDKDDTDKVDTDKDDTDKDDNDHNVTDRDEKEHNGTDKREADQDIKDMEDESSMAPEKATGEPAAAAVTELGGTGQDGTTGEAAVPHYSTDDDDDGDHAVSDDGLAMSSTQPGNDDQYQEPIIRITNPPVGAIIFREQRLQDGDASHGDAGGVGGVDHGAMQHGQAALRAGEAVAAAEHVMMEDVTYSGAGGVAAAAAAVVAAAAAAVLPAHA